MDRLKDRIALITGAARGLGEQIALRMKEEGATVIRSDLRAGGGPGGDEVFAMDVASEECWARMVEHIGRDHGRLDILVNNAGVENTSLIADLSLADWRRVMSVNSDAVFLGTKAMQSLLAEGAARRGGTSSIINIASMASKQGAIRQTAYCASKAACAHFTKASAMEFATLGLNIRVNSIHPTAIDTPLFRETMMRMDQIPGTTIEEKIEVMSSYNPMRKVGKPDDIAWAAVYLASDEAAFTNGLELLVDGASYCC